MPALSGPANRARAPRMRATPAICYSLLCLPCKSSLRPPDCADRRASRAHGGARRIFAASPQPARDVCPFLPPPSARPNLASPSRFSRIRDGCPRRRAASARAASGHRCRAQKGEAGEARQAAAEQAPRRPDGHTTRTPPELVHSTWQRQPPRFRPFV